MSRRGVGLASLLMVMTMLLVSWVVGHRLPADIRLPTHWNAAGIVDGYSGKWTALLMPAALTLILSAIFYALPALEPRQRNLERSRGLYLWTWLGLLFILGIVQFAVTAAALAWKVDVARLMVGAIGALFATIGNQLGKSRRMYLVGIRTPWTLASEEVWIGTHRLGGKLMTGAGLATILVALLPVGPAVRWVVVLAMVLGAAVIPVFYSYWLWRHEQLQGPQSSE